MVIDLGVCMSDSKQLESFVQIARNIGFTGLATYNLEGEPDKRLHSGFSVLKRVDISGNSLKTVRKQVDSVRRNAMIVSVKLTSIDLANWAAEDQRVDLITVDHSLEYRFRDTTARLAAESDTALEIRFEPLLRLAGLNRSKVIKIYRETVRTAIEAGMQVVLSSGAKQPLQLRSPMAMRYICELLGMESKYAENAVKQAPLEIVERNRERCSSGYVADGMRVLQED